MVKYLIDNIDAQYVKVNGTRIRYMVTGNGAPVVLLHGFGEFVEAWMSSIENLREHFKVYALDLPGHGLSDKPVMDYSLASGTGFAAAFIQQMGLENPSIVGHSMGGLIGLQLAINSPEKVSRLVLVDAMGLSDESPMLYRLSTLPVIGEIVVGLTLKAGLKEGLKRSFFDPDFITEEMLELNYKYLKMAGAKRVMLSILRNSISLSGPRHEVVLTGKLPHLKTPTLFIHGAQDRTVPVKHTEEACRLMPDARLKVIDSCGHCPHIEKAGEFSREVIGFLNSNGH